MVDLCAVDINAAYAVSVAIQGAGEWLTAAAYRRPAVCRSGGFPVFPVGGVVQQDVGGELAASGCVPCHAIRTVHYGCEEAQLVGGGNQVEVAFLFQFVYIAVTYLQDFFAT